MLSVWIALCCLLPSPGELQMAPARGLARSLFCDYCLRMVLAASATALPDSYRQLQTRAHFMFALTATSTRESDGSAGEQPCAAPLCV